MIQLYCEEKEENLLRLTIQQALQKKIRFTTCIPLPTQPPTHQPLTSPLQLVLIPKSSILLIRQILKSMHSIFILGLGNSRAGNLVAFGIAAHQSNA